jgi:uncharacterized protein YneF (UPF0154 family)
MEEEEILINGKFNNKHSKYKSIKYTNVTLFILFYFLEVIFADLDGQTANILGVAITFFIARYFIREIFKKNPDFNYKILKTFGVYLGVFIIKSIILTIILVSLGAEI